MVFRELPIDQILPPQRPMREDMDLDAFRALVATVKAVGLLQPITVKPIGDKWEVVAGERRWRAAMEAGLTMIPCMEKDLSQVGTRMAMAIENLHREDIAPLDAAAHFAAMQDEDGLTVEEIAQLLNVSAGFVSSRIALLRAPADVRDALKAGRITFTVARELARCHWDDDRTWLLHHAMDRSPTADTVRRWVMDVEERHRQFPDTPAPTEGSPAPEVSAPLKAICEVHRGEVLMDEIITLRVCGRCYTWLGTHHPSGDGAVDALAAPPQPAPPQELRWQMIFVRETSPGEPVTIELGAPDEPTAREVFAEGMAKEFPGERWILVRAQRVIVGPTVP